MKKALVALAIVGAMVPLAGNAFALCGGSVPMIHGLDSFFVCDNSRGPVSAFAYQVSAPATSNTGTEFIAVNLVQASPGVPGEVQIQTDWGNSGIVGCPQDATGNHRVMIVVQATDGTGILASISGADAGVGYLVETAHTFDPSSGLAFPLPCTAQNGRPVVNGLSSNTVSVHIDPPHVFSDCDANSVGIAGLGDTCPDSFGGAAAAAAIGGIYSSTQPCGTRPDIRKTAWSNTGLSLGPTGDVVVPFTKPAAATDCNYIGTTTTVSGVESSSITAFISVQGGTVAQPKAENVKVASTGGKLNVSWTTSTELGLAGFRFLTSTKAKGQFEIGSFVAANGSRSYSASFGMGDFKGGRSLIVRAVLTDGTTVDAAPVNF